MIHAAPPPLIVPAKPAIITAAEPWEVAAHRDMGLRGFPRHVRRAVVAELKRLCGVREKFIWSSLEDLSRYAGMDVAMLPGLPSAVAATVSKRIIVEVGGTDFSTTDGNQYTFELAAGTPRPGRRVLVGYALADNGTATAVTSATMNGNPVTPVNEIGGATQCCAGWLIMQVDSGSTVTVVINGATNAWQVGVARAYAIHGLSSNTAADTGGQTGTTQTTRGDTISGPKPCAIFGGVAWRDTADVDSTWTGLASKDNDEYRDTLLAASFAHEVFNQAQVDRAVSVEGSQGPLQSALVLASFGL